MSTPPAVVRHHIGDDVDVVLEVGVDGHYGIAISSGDVHAGYQCLLLTHTGSETDTAYTLVPGVESSYLPPCVVGRAVVDIQDTASFRHLLALRHGCQQCREPVVGRREHLLLIVAGHHDDEHRQRSSIFFCFFLHDE